MAARTLEEARTSEQATTTATPLATVDALLAGGAGLLAVAGSDDELAVAAEHIARRAAACQRRCLRADGRRHDEPWRDVAAMLRVDPSQDARGQARSLLRAAGDAVVVVIESRPGAWAAALVASLRSAFDDRTRTAVLVLTPRRVEGIDRVTLGPHCEPDDLARYYGLLVEASAARATSLASLSELDAWWHGRGSAASSPAEDSAAACALQQRLALLRRPCPERVLPLLGDPIALAALQSAETAHLTDGLVSLTSAPPTPSSPSREDLLATAEALQSHSPDPWAWMRAAELWAMADERERAMNAATNALDRAHDAALRADLWDRFDTCLGDSLDDEELVACAERALARADLEQALRLARRASARRSFSLSLMVGRVAHARGDLSGAAAALDEARKLADEADDHAAVALELGEVALSAGRRDEARTQAERCAQRCDSVDLALAARNLLGKVLLAEGRWQEAESHFEEDAQRAEAGGRQTDLLRARLNRAVALMSEGRRLQARAELEAILESGEQLGEPRAVAFALANLAALAALGHAYGEALELSERAISAMRSMGDALKLARQILNLAELRLRVGLVEEAEQALLFARQACGPALGDALVSMMSLVAARVQIELGSTLRASALVEQAVAAADRSSDGAKRGESLRLATRISLEDGYVAKAEMLLDRAAHCPAGPGAEAELLLLRALSARAAGHAFAEQAAEALALARRDDDIELARQAHELLCRAARQQGDIDAAREELRQALALRDRMAQALPSQLRPRYLQRRDLRALAELEVELERAVELEGSAGPLHRSRTITRDGQNADRSQRQMVGTSSGMRALRQAIAKVAASDATVLIGGESGTGKELVANALHQGSDRRGGPLVKVHCAALVETLLLSELFGHERGAFTGAQERRRGRFEQAHGGTIFLDEIGDISPKTQVALLRVLQERCFERVGGTQPVRVDVRVVCATHRDLRAMVAAGTFREDLYYRLAGVTLQVPSLRERRDDLALLAEALLERIGMDNGGAAKQLSHEALAGLRNHDWPGNVRELDNALRAAALFAAGPFITLDDLTENVASLAHLGNAAEAPPTSFVRSCGLTPSDAAYAEVKDGTSLPELKRMIERACIERALEEAGGNITQAARLLGMKRPRVSQLVNQFAREDGGAVGEEVVS